MSNIFGKYANFLFVNSTNGSTFLLGRECYSEHDMCYLGLWKHVIFTLKKDTPRNWREATFYLLSEFFVKVWKLLGIIIIKIEYRGDLFTEAVWVCVVLARLYEKSWKLRLNAYSFYIEEHFYELSLYWYLY